MQIDHITEPKVTGRPEAQFRGWAVVLAGTAGSSSNG